MVTKYEIGQKVLVKPVSEQDVSLRAAALQPYAGQTGEITDYHWIYPPNGNLFYLYTIRIGEGGKEIVLYEDEINPIYP